MENLSSNSFKLSLIPAATFVASIIVKEIKLSLTRADFKLGLYNRA